MRFSALPSEVMSPSWTCVVVWKRAPGPDPPEGTALTLSLVAVTCRIHLFILILWYNPEQAFM